MDLTSEFRSAEDQPDTEDVLITNVEVDIEERGHVVDTPVFYLRGRTADGDLRETEVVGFRPYFGLTQEDCVANISNICNDRRVLGVQMDCSPDLWADTIGIDDPDNIHAGQISEYLTEQLGANVYHQSNVYTSLHDEPLAHVYCRVPEDTNNRSGMPTDLDCETFEADVGFTERFLIDTEIYQSATIPSGTDRIRYENWPGESEIDRTRDNDAPIAQDLEPCDPPDVEPRTVVYDIEVLVEDDGFPKPEHARKPITAIAGYDSYTEDYKLFGLKYDGWADNADGIEDAILENCRARDGFPNDPDVELYDSETELLVRFNEWVLGCDPDIFTGYNADGFDTPYLIQRCYNKNARNIQSYASPGDPGVWVNEHNGDRSVDFALSGRCTLDILDAYRKTQFRALDSYTLDAVAEAELGFGKTDLEGDDLDNAWQEQPVQFFTYNIRDTQATVGVEREAGLLDLFENLRKFTGAPYEAAVNNGPMLDILFLRQAYESNRLLPTNTVPDETVYHGAKVFPSVPGVHKNCVYPDLSSLYPNLFAMLNLGPETIVGNKEALDASEYVEDDCFKFPVDNREFAIVEKGETIDHIDRDKFKGVKTPKGGVREMFDAKIDWLYAVKPDIKESFITEVIDGLIDLKNQYRGDLYAAIKRITNSVYGIVGDSSSVGKGSRLYNRKVAEGITLAGRMTITHTAEQFTGYLNDHYDPDAQLVGGDTDSSTTSIPNAPNLQTAFDWAKEATEFVDESYDEFAREKFNFLPDDEHRLHVELESLASALFYMKGDEEQSYEMNANGYLERETTESGVQKRYAQHIVWDDDDGWIDTADIDDYPEALEDTEDRSEIKNLETITYDTYETGALSDQDQMSNTSITGFEFVRSDSAQITRDAQLQILTDILLASDAHDRIESYLSDLVDDVKAGDVPITDLARPKGIGQSLEEYGWKDIDELDDDDITEQVELDGGKYRATPGPAYRGAKYADEWFPWEDLGEGSKPLKIPIEKVRNGEYPAAYEYTTFNSGDYPESPEIGRPVDAIAVSDPDRVPPEFVIDYEQILEKELRDKTEDILDTVGISYDDVLGEGTQVGLEAFA